MVIFGITPPRILLIPTLAPVLLSNPESRASNEGNPGFQVSNKGNLGSRKTYWGPSPFNPCSNLVVANVKDPKKVQNP